MATKGQMTDMFKQLEEVMNKCDSLSQNINEIKREHKKEIKNLKEDFKKKENKLNDKIKELENIIVKKDKEIIKLNNEVDRLKKQKNNNSDNSSLPPSTDIKINKKEIPNNREKTNRKVGGQEGHKGYNLSKKEVEEKINKKEYKHQIINIGKKKSKEYISKYILDIEVKVLAKEYRFFKDKEGKYNIPKEFQSDVQYGTEIKTLCSILNTEGIVAIDRLTDFVESITHNKMHISNGSIVNFMGNLKEKCKPIIQRFEEKILNSELLYTDGTTARSENKNVTVRNYSTTECTLLKATLGKGKKNIAETNILPKYTGDVVHDHETVIYNYGREHIECNVHISRYLKGNYQDTGNSWSKDMRNFLNSLNKYRKELKEKGIEKMSDEKLQKYSLRYDNILQKGREENKKVTSEYYKKSEKRLLNRLEKYKKNHLMFIYNFELPFDNNLSERELRHVKSKQKISGYFKTMTGLQGYLDIKSIIITCKKNSLNFYEVIKSIFENAPVTIV